MLIIISGIILLFFLQNTAKDKLIDKNAVPPVSDLVELVPPSFPASDSVNLANFQKIKNGMTIEEVEKVFADNEVAENTEFDGFIGVEITNDENLAIEEKVYEFHAPDEKGKAVVTFKDDKVIKKEQFDLK